MKRPNIVTAITNVLEVLRDDPSSAHVMMTLSDDELKVFLEHDELHVQKLPDRNVYRISLYMVNVTLIA